MADSPALGQNVPNLRPEPSGLYLMDGIAGLSSLPEHSVDMLLTDPPYGTTRNYWDVPLPLPELWEAVRWAVKPSGAVLFFAQCPYDKVLGADTETLTSELMVSVFGSLAQEESISIGKNQRISYQRRMERGEFITCKAPFGYQMPDGKNLTIHEPEASIVRKIFALYLQGRSAQEIADIVSETGIPTRDGKLHWNTTTICYILTNEKYVGDALCQKTLATESFPYVKKRNEGEKGQYYVDMTHPAIISRDAFERARRLLNRRAPHKALDRKEYPLRRKMICQQCGSTCVRKELASGYISWCCYKHTKSAQACPVGRIPESEIYAAFVRMYNKLRLHEGIVLTPALAQLDDLNAALQRGNPAMLAVNKAIAEVAEQSCKVSQLRVRGLLDESACTAKLLDINSKLTELRRERRQLLKNEDIEDVIDALHQTVNTLHAGPENLDDFDETLFADLVEKIIAESQTCIRFRLYGGIELREQLREVKR